MVALEDQIAAFCRRHALLVSHSTVVVAVSGGPDSVCLLHVLRTLALRWQLQLHVAHLDHQLRLESGEDAQFVAQLAEKWQLPITIKRVDIAEQSRVQRTGIEATARAARLQFLSELAQQVGAKAIALGHNADDQAETVVMRLMRGAGPSGLAAMQPKRPAANDGDARNIALTRPLLATSRADIEAYCELHQLTPRQDPTNSLPIYTRNRVRGYILPLLKTYNPRIVAALGRTARVCAEENDLIDQLVQQTWTAIAVADGISVRLDRQQFEQLHRALRRRMVRQAATMLVPNVELEAKHIDLALDAVEQGRRRLQMPGGLWLVVSQTQLQITMEQATS
jgi:tRNA(Ile)-lysidine synthase